MAFLPKGRAHQAQDLIDLLNAQASPGLAFGDRRRFWMLHLASFLDQTVVFGEQMVGLVVERLPLLRAGSHMLELSRDRAQFGNHRVCIPLYPHWEPLDPPGRAPSAQHTRPA